jgi:hypothetical protein
MPPASFPARPWRAAARLAAALGVVAALALVAALAWRVATGVRAASTPAPPRVTHDVVVQQVRDVATLVSSEMTIRDVIVYEQTRFATTKRALLVVTGRVLAGIDLQRGADVRIDHEARRITVSLPPAQVVSVDVVNVRTYDERAGLLNPFRPADRDAIQQQVRAQLAAAAEESGILGHADRAAGEMLRRLLARDGYTVEVTREPVVRAPTG